ncbi:MAG: metal ABC transporter ATP-binding protein [Vampirovibrionales bacterium]|nr:metal ABC transporter ATP-binding protein [Vampirovibrionales bacterium]
MTPAALEISGLSLRYEAVTALSQVTLTLPQGAFLALLGPNGAGKSSFLRLILGLLTPSEGVIQIFGESPARRPAHWVGYVPQIKTLDRSFPGLARELVATGAHPRWPWQFSPSQSQGALAALDQVGAAHLADRPLAALSGGELQRVYLARCLARNPKLIVLDEPATGIDATLADDLYRILEACQRRTGATILMATHDLEVAHHHASHALLLNIRMMGFGPPGDALRIDRLEKAFGHGGHGHHGHGGPESAPPCCDHQSGHPGSAAR